MYGKPEVRINELGTKFWYLPPHGIYYLHREDGPAIESTKGYREWWLNNELHRIDGPAVQHIDGKEEWWVSGKKFDTKEVKDWIKQNNIDLTNEGDQLIFLTDFCRLND